MPVPRPAARGVEGRAGHPILCERARPFGAIGGNLNDITLARIDADICFGPLRPPGADRGFGAGRGRAAAGHKWRLADLVTRVAAPARARPIRRWPAQLMDVVALGSVVEGELEARHSAPPRGVLKASQRAGKGGDMAVATSTGVEPIRPTS